jgi:hypothetical protein
MPAFPFSLASPWLFAIACALSIVAVAIAIVRRPAIHATTSVLSAIVLLLFALAVGGLTWHRPASADVVVMVDLSASTRGAEYRDRAALDQRIKQLVGSTPYHILYFSDHNTASIPSGALLADMTGDKTIYAPPAAIAVLLFSDGQFELSAAAPPTFAVADPALDQPDDAAVSRLEMRQNQIAATITQTGAPRRLTIDSAATQPIIPIEGPLAIARTIRPGATVATAQLNKGDRWPENDALSIALTPPMRTQRWYVSNDAAPPGDWISIRPGSLTTSSTDYLSPSVIVLDNLPASDLSGAQQNALEQYVRDLGGALIIAGGGHAFSSGFYPGTALETLSPLASSPPTPSVHWMLLADSSGSMSEAVGNSTRWQIAASSIAALIPNLPADDPVTVGSFAAELTWWSSGKSARETAALTLLPPGVSPSGPTNLAAALDRIARESAGGLASELLVVSDADTTIDRPDELVRRLKEKKIRLHVLAIGDGSGLKTLQDMTSATGGTLRRQLDPAKWATEVRKLLGSAWPKRLIEMPTNVRFINDLAALPPRPVLPWNRIWLKKSASPLAQTDYAAEQIPLCARWTVGNGEVVACGFAPTPAEIGAIAKLIAKPPRDPRFAITWNAGPNLKVRIDASQAGQYLNGLALKLDLSEDESPTAAQIHAIPQTAAGRYELSLPAPRRRTFASIRQANSLIDRIAVAARYAPEFDAIGNNYDALRTLTQRTGGKVIDRSWTKPIDFPFPRRELALAPWLGFFGAVVMALGLARWRVA